LGSLKHAGLPSRRCRAICCWRLLSDAKVDPRACHELLAPLVTGVLRAFGEGHLRLARRSLRADAGALRRIAFDMTEREEQIGQAALAIMDHGGPHITAIHAVTSKLKEQGFQDAPLRAYYFLELLGLISTKPAGPGFDNVVLGNITDKGREAQKLGLPVYLKRQSDDGNKRYKLFISHSSRDKEILGGLVDLLIDPLGLTADEIFSTSTEGTGIETGEEWRDAIRSAILHSDIVLLMISENYKQSEICLNEMGAAWMSNAHVIPVLLGRLTHGSVGVLAQVKQVDRLDDEFALERVKDKLVSELQLKPAKSDRWAKKKKRFLQLCGSDTTPVPPSRKIEPPRPIEQAAGLAPPQENHEEGGAQVAATNVARTNLTVLERKGPIANRLHTYYDWNITRGSLCNGRQHANFQAQTFDQGILTSLKCKVRINANYMRFGVKFRRATDANFSQSGSITQPGTILFHIGQEERSNAICAWVVRDEPREPKLHACQASVGDTVEFKLHTMGSQRIGYLIQFYVDGLLQFTESVPTDIMSNVVLIAWRDNVGDASIDVSNLVITSGLPK
jgi:hypothetical protein